MTGLSTLVRRAAARALRPLRAATRGPSPDAVPAPGDVSFGSLRRTSPISREYGFDRGNPVDRYYIESFLAWHSADIRGRVLEVGDDSYTRRFGGPRVTRAEVFHAEAASGATYVGDLSSAAQVPSNTFDCIVFTQTLHLIYEARAALVTLHRILAPGGVLLLTVPGITQISDHHWRASWYWSFTTVSARRMAAEVFGASSVEVTTYGNVLAATSFLYGLAAEELRRDELDVRDRDYEVIIAVRAVKGEAA